MARRTKKIRPESVTGGYSAMPWQVFDSTSFKGASDKAKALLWALMRQHNGENNGHLHLANTWLSKQGYKCPASNQKARIELIERSLIVQTKMGGLNNGSNLFALTWLDISNFVGLEINSKEYSRGTYLLNNLPPSARRKQPIKKIKPFIDCNSADSHIESVSSFAVSLSERETALIRLSTLSLCENNVITPLQGVNNQKRIVGVKGKSGIFKLSNNTRAGIDK